MPSDDDDKVYTRPMSDEAQAESEQKKDDVDNLLDENELAKYDVNSRKMIVISDEGIYHLPLKLKLTYYDLSE